MEEGGGYAAVTGAQTVEKKPSCVHNPDDYKPGPDVAICPVIVSLNVGIWAWMIAFSLAQTFLGHSVENTLFLLTSKRLFPNLAA